MDKSELMAFHEDIEVVRNKLIGLPESSVFDREAKAGALKALRRIKERLWKLERGEHHAGTTGNA